MDKMILYIIDQRFIFGIKKDFTYTQKFINKNQIPTDFFTWLNQQNIHSDTELVEKLSYIKKRKLK